MSNVKVRVKISNIAIGPSPTDVTTYKRGTIFECTDEQATRLGKDVEIIEKVEDPVVKNTTQTTATKK